MQEVNGLLDMDRNPKTPLERLEKSSDGNFINPEKWRARTGENPPASLKGGCEGKAKNPREIQDAVLWETAGGKLM